MDKILLVNKPTGWTSFDVVAKIRSLYSKREGRKIKVGHAGTLDPFATGLLVILVGKATKKQADFTKLDKEYEATLRLGAISTTGDPEGEIKKIKGCQKVNIKKIKDILPLFIGEITQLPPAYSAVKINGQRAYKLAREGKKVVTKPRKVQIYNIELLNYEWPRLKLRIKCSSGTYIRSLVIDIGKKLGTEAYTENLVRTRVGMYNLKKAKNISAFENLST